MSTSFDVRFTDSSGAKLKPLTVIRLSKSISLPDIKNDKAEEKKHFLQNFNHLYVAAQLNSVDIL